jgi:hypothetical protein
MRWQKTSCSYECRGRGTVTHIITDREQTILNIRIDLGIFTKEEMEANQRRREEIRRMLDEMQ